MKGIEARIKNILQGSRFKSKQSLIDTVKDLDKSAKFYNTIDYEDNDFNLRISTNNGNFDVFYLIDRYNYIYVTKVSFD